MSTVVISGDSSGSVSLTVPSVAGTNTATLPAATGTVMVSGNMPAFSAKLTNTQTVSVNTWTKIACNSVEYDTNSNYNNSTYRFTPTVAGYYQVTGGTGSASGGLQTAFTGVYKNGSLYKQGSYISATGAFANGLGSITSCFVYLNGSTDYIEFYVYYQATGSINLQNSGVETYFQASMTRAA